MSIKVTAHAVGNKDVLGPQVGDAFTVASGAVSAALSANGSAYYRIKALADCTVRCGGGSLADATGGESWSEGDTEIRLLQDGSKIAVGAA